MMKIAASTPRSGITAEQTAPPPQSGKSIVVLSGTNLW